MICIVYKDTRAELKHTFLVAGGVVLGGGELPCTSEPSDSTTPEKKRIYGYHQHRICGVPGNYVSVAGNMFHRAGWRVASSP
jgi:hypothetical protein